MKKLCYLLVLVMFCSFVKACEGGTNSTPNSAQPSGANNTNQADKAYNITFIMPVRNEFINIIIEGMEEVCEKLNITLTTKDVRDDSSLIIQYVETAHSAGEDAVVVLPVDSEVTPEIVEAAGGMPVVILNRSPRDLSIFGGKVAYVGSDEWQAGSFQGEYLAGFFKEQDIDTAKVIFLLGTLGAENVIKRTESAKEALKNAGITVDVVAELATKAWDRAEAMALIEPLVGTADYNCIIANNDSMALGAVEALNAAGIDPTSVPIVGIDATGDGLDAVKAGTLKMTVFQDGKGQGAGSLQAALNMIKGNVSIAEGTNLVLDTTYNNVAWIPFVPVYQNNVNEFE
jgi:ABC-type sugar transport system substrate-binding protein